MENDLKDMGIKELLQKGSELKTSINFTDNVMMELEKQVEKQTVTRSYLRKSSIVFIVGAIASVFVLNFLSGLACRFSAAHCEFVQYALMALIAILVLVEFNYLVTQFSRSKEVMA